MHDGDSALTTSVAIYLAIEDAIVNSINVKEYTVEELMKVKGINENHQHPFFDIFFHLHQKLFLFLLH